MSLSIVIVILGVLTSTKALGSPVQISSSFSCPADDDCSISQCLYLNPDDCNTFWHCDASKQAILKSCNPSFLEFNDFVKVCDWSSDQTCRPANPSPTTEAPPETTTTTTEVSPPFTCPPNDDCMISHCLHPNLDDCTKFWYCTQGRNPVVKQCPPPLEYNDIIKVCDWPSDQTCKYAPNIDILY